MIPDIEFLTKYFYIYNKKYFYSKLPLPIFKLHRPIRYLGYYKNDGGNHIISICESYDGEERFFENTLIHEMIHYYLNFTNIEDKRSHGRNFYREAKRINADGWNIQGTATEEDMAFATRIYYRKSNSISTLPIRNLFSYTPTEQELIDFIIENRSKNKTLRLWACYRHIQELIYNTKSQENITEECSKRRNKAIEKSIKSLLSCNKDNYYAIYVLHTDLSFFYAVVDEVAKSKAHAVIANEFSKYNNDSKYEVGGKIVIPIN